MSCFITDISCAVLGIEVAERFEKSSLELKVYLSHFKIYIKDNFNINLDYGTFDDVRRKMAEALAVVNVESYNATYPDDPESDYKPYIPTKFRVEEYSKFVDSIKYISEEDRFDFDDKIFLQALKWLECYSYNSENSNEHIVLVCIIKNIIQCMKEIYINNQRNYAVSRWC